MKQRSLLGTKMLDKAIQMHKEKRIPISTVVKVLEIDKHMHYRTAYDIIRAEIEGFSKLTRPEWLKPEPIKQTAPQGWLLKNGFGPLGYWKYNAEM